MNNLLERILNRLEIAYACLSAEREIIAHNPLFARICGSGSGKIEDQLPELVGFEKIIDEISAGRRKQFRIEFIQRQEEDGEHYFHFYLFPASESGCSVVILIQDVSELTRNRQKILQQQNEILLLQHMAAERSHFLSSSILGHSPAIQKLRTAIHKIALAPSSAVLLLGESGSGKNLVARVLHYNSPAAAARFVEINCAAIPEALLESELFGYEKGAFTSALQERRGLIEEANGGTLFLDEIAELPLKLQAKLLSVLEAKRFRRLGSNQERNVKFRLVAATNRDLRQMVQEGTFREDLYYRLNVVTLQLPPLRELGDDILLIADHFREVFNKEFKKNVRGFTRSAQKALLRYDWPGNVRELSNCIERAMIFTESATIDEEELIFQPHPSSPEKAWELPEHGLNLEELEISLLRSALKKSAGNKSKAARLLGLSRDTLRYRLEKYNLE